MLSGRYYLRLLSAFFSRFKGIMFVGLVFGLIIFIALKIFFPVFFGTTTEYIGITGRFHTDSIPNEILGLISEGLTSVSEEGEIVSGLAESWETTDGGKTWIFYLKENQKWHDSSDVTAETIQYSFDDLKITRPDSNTIIFELDAAFSPFPSVVSRPTFKKGLLGTGEWKVKNISLAGSYVEKLTLEKDNERKVIKFFPTEEKTKIAYKLGNVDKIIEIIDPNPFDEWKTSQVTETLNLGHYVGIFFNTAKTEGNPLADKKLRQSLSYAINKETLGTKRAIGPISPNSWAYNPQIKDYEYDTEHAKDLLSDFSEEALDNMEIQLTTTPSLLPIAEKIIIFWKDIGVNATIQITSHLPSDYQAFLAIYDIPEDPDQYATWHSTQTVTNISNYSNPRIDKLLEDGRLELDPELRKKIYLDFQRFLLEDAPAVFLYHPISYTITRDK